jgi:MFS family permease
VIGTVAQIRSFSRPVQLLLVNQLTINIGFYMLMPYLAGYLSGQLALAGWAVGLVLGVRNFSQQGMFLLGGTLADQLGYKPLILAGLGLRVAGFALLGVAGTLPVLIVASLLTGLAGALFNPAVRAYLAAEAGDRKTEAFATFNVFYQAGILAGPLIGLALLTVSFQAVCLIAAVLFALLLAAQARALPARRGEPDPRRQGVLADWRQVLRNRPFLLFAVAMAGSYVLNFQVYLALPLQVRRATGSETGVAVLFAVSGLLTVIFQVRLTAWFKKRCGPPTAITLGVALMAVAFLPPAVTAHLGAGASTGLVDTGLALLPVLVSTIVLTVATMTVYPFEMAMIVDFAGPRLVGTYYGLYNTIAGIGITLGNLLTGTAFDLGDRRAWPALPWLLLAATAATCTTALAVLTGTGQLTAAPPQDTAAGQGAPASRS